MTSDGDNATIMLTRERHAWRDSLRSYHVLIDGGRAGKIRRGQTLELPVAPGRHEIDMRISWCRSPVIKIARAYRWAKGETEFNIFRSTRVGPWAVLASFWLPGLSQAVFKLRVARRIVKVSERQVAAFQIPTTNERPSRNA